MADLKGLNSDPISDWINWFAWYPVKTWEGEWLWLRVIERRRMRLHSYLRPDAPFYWWQYARKGG